jgi:hypothetical protein
MTQDMFSSNEDLDVIRTALRDLLDEVPPDLRPSLIQRVAFLKEEQRVEERERCVQLCRHRAELWRKTTSAHSNLAPAREEARSRANEASYLADLLASGRDMPEAEPDA